MHGVIRKKRYWGALVVVVFGSVWWFFYNTTSDIPVGITIEPVSRAEVQSTISETGTVVPAQEVHLSFERGGHVAEILVTEGEEVNAGDTLLKLDATDQQANLITARARLSAEEFRLDELLHGADSASLAVTEGSVRVAETALKNAKENLMKVIAQQDTLVANALKTLRSTSLQAYIVDGEREEGTRSYSAPTVTGTYTGDTDGVYTIALYNSAAPSGASFKVSGLETDTQSVSTVQAVPLGTHGLYIQFPENFAPRTVWDIPIPNTRASGYLANLNAYNAVVETRDVAVSSAESALRVAEATYAQAQAQLVQVSGSARDERINAQQALVTQMQAGVLSAQFAQSNMSIIAPFQGTVTSVSPEIGEVVAPTTPAVSLIASSTLELLVNISESDIKEVSVGDSATAVFDAYDGVTLSAKVTSVAPTAKIVDGVHVFEVRLQFDTQDGRIRAGLSADIDIMAASHEKSIAIPSRAVIEKDGGKFVRALDGKKLVYLPITTGLRGSNGMTEITSGLTEGQSIITFAEDDAIKQLEGK